MKNQNQSTPAFMLELDPEKFITVKGESFGGEDNFAVLKIRGRQWSETTMQFEPTEATAFLYPEQLNELHSLLHLVAAFISEVERPTRRKPRKRKTKKAK